MTDDEAARLVNEAFHAHHARLKIIRAMPSSPSLDLIKEARFQDSIAQLKADLRPVVDYWAETTPPMAVHASRSFLQ